MSNKIKSSMTDRVFDTINVTLMIIIMILMLYPLYFTIIASLYT